ncbi:MAG: glycosyltransferase family 4 protein, partial [Deltaproteobacteria bacterium]
MRIGLVRMRFSPFGGAEVFLKRFISELKKKGHSIEVFSADWPAEDGITVHRVSLNCPSFLRPIVFARNVGKAIKEAAPDVVVSLERTFSQDIYRGADGCHREWLAKRQRFLSGIKRLAVRLSPMHRGILNLEKRLFKDQSLKYVVAISERCKEEYIRHYNLPAEKICVIYCGIDTDEFSPERLGGLRPKARAALGLKDDAIAVL